MANRSTTQSPQNVDHDCETWPMDQKERWTSLFGGENDPPIWVRQTQYQNAGVYTRYLNCVTASGLPVGIHGAGLRRFILQCHGQAACARTISGYLWAIYKVARITQPDEDRSWLYASCLRVQNAAMGTTKKRSNQVAPAEEILEFALSLIGEARRNGPATWKSRQMYRDGLLMAFGIFNPERLRALTAMTLSDLNLESGLVTFGVGATKTKIEAIRTLPDLIRGLLKEWIAHWRPLSKPAHDCVWVAKSGRAPCSTALYVAMRKVSRMAGWGYSLTPKLLRNSAATFLAQSSPEDAQLIQHILYHASAAMAVEYTGTAKRFQASREARKIYAERRKSVEVSVRATTSSTIAQSSRSMPKRRAANAAARRNANRHSPGVTG
jgi:integrase